MIKYSLLDDGTMDTVVACYCPKCGWTWEERIDCEYAADYRDDDVTMIDLDGLVDSLCIDCPECEG